MRGFLIIIMVLAAGATPAAEPDSTGTGVISDFQMGASYAWSDSLGVIRPLRIVLTADLVPGRLFLDIEPTGVIVLISPEKDLEQTKFGGDILPAAASALWIVGARVALGEGTTASWIVASPAVVLGLTVLQPRLRWQATDFLWLAGGWGSEWHLFNEETGMSWRPTLMAIVQPLGSLRLEAGVTHTLFWSFDGESRDWGGGWYAGLTFRPTLY